MRYEVHSEPGGKALTEDCLVAKRHPSHHATIVFALADGQGGQSNGADAAKAACDAVWSQSSSLHFQKLEEETTWVQILEATDRAVSTTGGFTTLVALSANGNSIIGASCGDSKAFFRASNEDSICELTSRQSKNPPIGSEVAQPTAFTCPTLHGGRLLVLSDGVWKYCGAENLRTSFQLPIEAVGAHLKKGVIQNMRSLPDDFSVIVADV